MAKYVPTKENVRQEKALHKVCIEQYHKVLDKVEALGWELIVMAADGFGIYSRYVDGKEHILNIDLSLATVEHQPARQKPTDFNFDEQPSEYKPSDTDTVSNRLYGEIVALSEWIELREPVRKWENFRSQYWDY